VRLSAGLGLVALAAAGWLVWSGLRARAELRDARQQTEAMRVALLGGDPAAAQAALAALTMHADNARALTAGPLWRLAADVPYLGRTPAAVTKASAEVDRLALDVLPGLVTVGRALDPKALRAGSTINVAALTAARPAVSRAAAGIGQAQSELVAIPLDGVMGPVADAVRSFQHQVADVRSQLDAAAAATSLLPAMLGSAGPRHYLVVFQNDAEARATGGLVGAFGVLQATNGRLSVTALGSDDALASASSPVVDLGQAYRQLFGSDPALWANTNLSAHFPSAAVQQLELWRRQFGHRLDGVVALDPVTLGYLLTATGPARLPGGELVTGAGVADLTMRAVYARYSAAGQVPERKAFLQVVAKAGLDSILGSGGGARAELTALGRAVGERRLLVYSAHPSEESVLASTPLGGVVDSTAGPYAGVAVDNASGSKIDYYLDRSLDYVLGPCPDAFAGAVRASTVTVTLHDGAPSAGLPAYAAYRLDRGPVSSPVGLGGDGSVRETVLVYTATGATLSAVTIDGMPTAATPGLDGASPGRPVFAISVELAAGQTRSLVFHLREPAVAVAPRGWIAPLVRPSFLNLPTVEAATCR